MGKNSLIKSTTPKKREPREKNATESTAVPAPTEDSVSAAAQSPEATQTAAMPTAEKGSDPMEKALKLMIAGLVALIVVVIAFSHLNHSRYTLKTANGGVEVWQGKFSPMGEKLLVTLPGMSAPETPEAAYSRSEALEIVFNYFLDRADALLEAHEIPDYSAIRDDLKKAAEFAVTPKLRAKVQKRLNHIDWMTLLYKAEVAASKDNPENLEAALGYLQQAAELDLNPEQSALRAEKQAAFEARLKELKAAVPTGTGETL